MAPIPIPSNHTPRSSLPSSASALASLAKRLPSSPISLTSIPEKLTRLVSRQQNPEIIPTTYGSINSGPAPGTVAGIVLGSVGGFLLILWLIYTCSQFGGVSSGSSYTESVVVRERRKSHGSARSRRSETVEVRRDRSPIRVVRPPERVERVVVEESRETRRDRSRSRGESDEVVVIEEHSPPRRSKSKREKEERRESGYRTVDPLAYGGVIGGRKDRRGSGR